MKELISLGTFKDDTDGTIKSVYQGKCGIIETTIISNKTSRNADVYCVPTHTYCNLGCKMCHLTNENSKRPMQRIDSESLIESIAKTAYTKSGERRSQNQNGWLSFMGVGEPLLNLDLIKETFQKESKLKELCNYENMTYALSTMMPNRGLEKLSKYVNENSIPLKVHFSMHSPFTKERLDLLPSTRVTIEESLTLLSNYRKEISQNQNINNNFKKFHKTLDPTEIHYTLIEGKNDSDMHLEKTIELLAEFEIPFKILTFNPTGNMKRSQREQIWISELKKALPNLKIKLYNPPGHKVGSSCGEFTKHYYLSELETKQERIEFEEWKNKYQIEKD